MSGYFKFLALYRTKTLYGPHFRIVIDPVTVETFDGPRSYNVPQQVTRVHPIGLGHPLGGLGKLSLPAGERFIALTSRQKSAEPSDIAQFEDAIDRIIAQLSTLYQPHLFFEQVYRGPVFDDPTKWWMSMSVRPGLLIKIDESQLAERLKSTSQILSADPELDRRYTLMSRFYSRSLQFDPSEEKFLLLWTCLEIFPMCDTTNIIPLRDYLSGILGRDAHLVKERLQLGQLHGIRSKLVHDGVLQPEERHLLFKKLELIVHAVMRAMSQHPYDGSLDEYFSA